MEGQGEKELEETGWSRMMKRRRRRLKRRARRRPQLKPREREGDPFVPLPQRGVSGHTHLSSISVWDDEGIHIYDRKSESARSDFGE